MKEVILKANGIPPSLLGSEEDPVILALLASRGVDSPEAVEKFLNPKLKYLMRTEDIPNVKETANFLRRNVEADEEIGIYGDYDVDGITASVILKKAIAGIGGKATIMIPNRFDEGYGISKEGIDRFIEMGIRKVISVDCGITSTDEVKYAFEQGMDIVITDHHTPEPELPDTLIVNPKLTDIPQIRELAGAGVALYIARQLLGEITPLLKELFFFGALGTVADVVPLTMDNRIITILGLDVLNNAYIKGIKELMDNIGSKPPFEAYHLGFMLAPRLNAAGRMEDASLAVDLMFSDSPVEAAHLLNEINSQRRKLQEELIDQAKEMSKDMDSSVLILSSDQFNRGINGIIASRMVELTHKPSIIFEEDADGMLHGSGRSVPGVDLHALLSASSEKFLSFGGHTMACGLRINKSDLEAVKAEIDKNFQKLYPDGFTKQIVADMELDLTKFTYDLHLKLQKLKPFGIGNPSPRFLIRGVDIRENKLVKDKYRFYDCYQRDIPFQLQDWNNKTDFGKNGTIDIIASPFWEEFRGQLYLKVKYIEHI